MARVLPRMTMLMSTPQQSLLTMVNVQLISWSIFIILAVIHVWANYVGMQMLRLRTLNRERAKVALPVSGVRK